MIRRLLFTIIWGYVFSVVAALLFSLAAPLIYPKPAGTQPSQHDIDAVAGMTYGIPGVGGFVGAGFAILGLLPGTSLRKKVFRPSTRPLLRELDPGLFALRQFLDGYPSPLKPASANARDSDLPRISLQTTGIISIMMAGAGLLCTIMALFRTTIPSSIDDRLVFAIALYGMSAICVAFCAALLSCGLDFVKASTRKVRLFGCLLMLEMLCLALAGFLARVLHWLVPQVGTNVGTAIEDAKSGLIVQVVVLFPLWAPFLALWAMYQLESQMAAGDFSAAARQGRPVLDKAELLKTMQAKYQVVRRMYQGFDYMPLLDASPAAQKAGAAAAMRFIRAKNEGQARYIQALTELSQVFDQAMPAYEAAAISAEVAFFQAVRAAMLKSVSVPEPAVEILEDRDANVPEIRPEDVILEPLIVEPVILEPVAPAAHAAPCDDSRTLYDALDVDDPEVEGLGRAKLQQISLELSTAIRRHVTIDWSVQKNARAEMRLMTKKILKKHGYPPNRHEEITQAVLQQAEDFCIELGGTGR